MTKGYRKYVGKYALIHNERLILDRFQTAKEAKDYAKWNYKGQKTWQVVRILK